MNRFLKIALICISPIILSTPTFALPIDWNGTFGADSTILNSYRRVDANSDNSKPTSMEPGLAPGGRQNASWQSYVFNLKPNLIINDAATIKAEFTTNYGRGHYFGESEAQRKSNGFANSLYYHNTSSGEDSLVVNQLYAELYANTATYRIGRHSTHWGLGSLYNSGEDTWDRHFSMRDGLTLDIKLGDFYFQPYWSKVSQGSSLSRSTNVREWGLSLLYDNPQRDLAFGILYGIKKSSNESDGLDQDFLGTGEPGGLGGSNVKIINLYFAQDFGNIDIGIEVPIINGELGNLYDNQLTDYKAQAILFESNWKMSNWTFGFDMGRVNGDAGNQSNFEALYLHPNYQVADILFRYNLHAVTDRSQNIYDSSITNTDYYKLRANYSVNKWSWDMAAIYARANEVATAGNPAFQHETNRRIENSSTNQASDMGLEFNFGFDYHWNHEIIFGSSVGYLFTGDYFTYSNDPTVELEADNTFLVQFRAGMSF